MPTLTIDSICVTVPDGATILEAARAAGITIPTLCHRDGYRPGTSCMVCVVEVEGSRRLLPSCATVALDGMTVHTDSEAVRRDRQLALELQLSHHTGDCEAPCRVACPANFDAALLLRHLQQGAAAAAARLAEEQLLLPRTLGAICPAPCEKVCRRGRHDAPLAIPTLHWSAAMAGCESPPQGAPASGRTVAIIGAGPAGVAAALRLAQRGHQCALFDQQQQPGGALLHIEAEHLPPQALAADLARIRERSIEFKESTPVLDAEHLQHLCAQYDVLLLATGNDSARREWGLVMGARGLQVDRETQSTSNPSIFAAGGLVRPIQRMAVRAVASGLRAAEAIDRLLSAGGSPASPTPVNVSMGALHEGELERLLEGASTAERRIPEARSGDLDAATQEEEARRCLHCDCRAATSCTLRDLATTCGASTGRWKGHRPVFEHDISHPEVVYEPGKCIACGLCIQISKAAGEAYGTTFLGRGIAVRVAPPLRENIAAALTVSAQACVAACPTGALSWKRD